MEIRFELKPNCQKITSWKAKRSSYGVAPGGCVCLKESMLEAMFEYAMLYHGQTGQAIQVGWDEKWISVITLSDRLMQLLDQSTLQTLGITRHMFDIIFDMIPKCIPRWDRNGTLNLMLNLIIKNARETQWMSPAPPQPTIATNLLTSAGDL